MKLYNNISKALLFGSLYLVAYNCDSEPSKKKNKVTKSDTPNDTSSGSQSNVHPPINNIVTEPYVQVMTPPSPPLPAPAPAPDPRVVMYTSLSRKLNIPVLNSSIIGEKAESILKEINSSSTLTTSDLDTNYYSYCKRNDYTLRQLLEEIYRNNTTYQLVNKELLDELNIQLQRIRDTNKNKIISQEIIKELKGKEREKYEILLRICKLLNINTTGVKSRTELEKIFIHAGEKILKQRLMRNSLATMLEYQRNIKKYSYKGIVKQLCIYQIISVSDMISNVINNKRKEKGFWNSLFTNRTSKEKFYDFKEKYSLIKRKMLYRLDNSRFMYKGSEPLIAVNHEELLLDLLTGKYFAKMIGEISMEQGINDLNLCRFYNEELIDGQWVQKRLDDEWVILLINEYGKALNKACSTYLKKRL